MVTKLRSRILLWTHVSVCIVLLVLVMSEDGLSQNMEIYDTKYGIKNVTPSIIIDENSFTGDFDVYSVSKYGLRNITPDAVIENDEYLGNWRVYRVSDYGVKDFIPSMKAKESDYDGTVRIHNVNELGLKDIAPSAIIERSSYSDEIRIYEVSEYGIKNVSPSEVIRKQGDQYNVYNVSEYGIPEMTPSRIIEVKEQPTVFGIVLLPSIKQIKYDPANTKLKAIQRFKELPDSLSEKEEWRSSKKKKESEGE
ncbi:MAG: hypothetical protein U9N55_03845 [candidate division Zixibacteria bacterium]|nr:hypothetical protein [candidate division Zixibacteria bacterium]